MSTAPLAEPAPPGSVPNRGCWKTALLGCGGAAILLVAALVGIFVYLSKNPTALTDLLLERVRAGYAADVTSEDKAELDAAYADFRRELEAKRIAREDIEKLRDTVKMGRDVGREEVHELTHVFREAVARAGTRDAGGGTRPAPAESTPTGPATPVP